MLATPEISWIAIAPDLILAAGAAMVLLIEVQWKPSAKRLGVVAGGAVAVAALFSILQQISVDDAIAVGDPEQLVGFAGMITMDGFAVFARFALLGVTGLGLLAGWRFVEGLGRKGAEALALVLLATTGFSIMVASNNLVMMFLGLEVGSISLYILAGMSRERPESDEAAIKYFLLGSFASAFFVYGVALIYAGTGQLEVLGVRGFLDQFIVTKPAIIYVGLGLIVAGLGFKVSAAPFHTWAPDVYQGAPAGIVGYMAAVAKIAGFVAIARILIGAVGDLSEVWMSMAGGVAALSMMVGSVLALVQDDVRRMLAYSGVAHAGFIMTGVVGGSTRGVLFYLAVYAIQLLGAFAVVAAVSGADAARSSIDRYRGLARRGSGLAAAFTILLLGMAGLPLTSGFVAKFGVFSDAWANGAEWLVVVAVLASVIAFAFYLRIIVVMYMDEGSEDVPAVVGPIRWVLALAVAATIVWGLFPASLLDLAANALPL
jgi:NADH-quinone oxidoreductase subunit N